MRIVLEIVKSSPQAHLKWVRLTTQLHWKSPGQFQTKQNHARPPSVRAGYARNMVWGVSM